MSPSASARAVIEASEVIITATISTTPLIEGEWFRPGQHITATGTDSGDKVELDVAALKRAHLVVDSRELNLQFGDVFQANKDFPDFLPKMVELGEVLSGRVPGRSSARQITIAKLVGPQCPRLDCGTGGVGAALGSGELKPSQRAKDRFLRLF